ncbi:MAG: hypothetical protein M3498_13330 [Deinococcota bacterium]|jgi:predicted ATPase|nr:hypothetical protein [Deinococcota bacterium]
MNAQTAESLLMFSEQARPGLSGLDVKTLLGQLEHQYSELIAALEWFIEQGHTDKALRLVIALAPFWMMTKRLVEGSAWFDHVLE